MFMRRAGVRAKQKIARHGYILRNDASSAVRKVHDEAFVGRLAKRELQGRTLAYCKPRRPSAFGFNLLHTRKLQRADWRASLTYRSGKNGTKRVLTGTLGKPRHGWRRRVGGGFWRGGARRPSSF